MKLNTTGIAGHLMLSLDRDVIAEKLIYDRRINPTPLQVRYPQGVRDVLAMMSEQLAISVADLTRILLEDTLHNMFLPVGNAAGTVAERLELLMQAHNLTATELSALLSPWNIRASVLREPGKLTDWLSPDALGWLADCFCVSPDWLSGRENYPVVRAGEWPDNANAFRKLISDEKNTDIIFWHSFPFAGNNAREYCGVILRQCTYVNNARIFPVLSLLPVAMTEEINLWFSGALKSRKLPVMPRAVSLRPAAAEALIAGRVLPALCLNTSLLPW